MVCSAFADQDNISSLEFAGISRITPDSTQETDELCLIFIICQEQLPVFSTDMYSPNSVKSMERDRRGSSEKLIIKLGSKHQETTQLEAVPGTVCMERKRGTSTSASKVQTAMSFLSCCTMP